jgi:hypothetical protein
MMLLMMLLLAAAAAAGPDTQISGAWVLELVAKIFAGLGVLFTAVWVAYRKGDADRKTKGSVTIDGQPIEFKKSAKQVSWSDHNNLVTRVGRMEARLDTMQDEQARRHVEMLTAGHEREMRITDALTNKLDQVATRWHERLDEVFGKPKPPPRR